MVGAIKIIRAYRFYQVERPTKIDSGLLDTYSPCRSGEHAVSRDPARYVCVEQYPLLDMAGELKRRVMAGRCPRKSRHHSGELRNDHSGRIG
jgi:hypothetical protein